MVANPDEALLAYPPPTSCYTAQFLTGHVPLFTKHLLVVHAGSLDLQTSDLGMSCMISRLASARCSTVSLQIHLEETSSLGLQIPAFREEILAFLLKL